MKSYLVQWEIEIDADTPREAALAALTIQRNPHPSAVVFDVIEADGSGEADRIDLLEVSNG